MYPEWLQIEEKNGEFAINIDKHAVPFGRFEPAGLSDERLADVPYNDKIVKISGSAPSWMYAYFAYHAYLGKAKS
jgi:hypothetical protein